jgi:hypothetical protein
VLQVTGRVGRLCHGLEHETLPNLHAFLAKMHRYTMLEAEARVAAGRPPRRRDAWIAPIREVVRRLVWKQGILDGPQGWAFGLLSGLSERVLADRHRRLWEAARNIVSDDAPLAHSVPWTEPPEQAGLLTAVGHGVDEARL